MWGREYLYDAFMNSATPVYDSGGNILTILQSRLVADGQFMSFKTCDICSSNNNRHVCDAISLSSTVAFVQHVLPLHLPGLSFWVEWKHKQ